MERHGFLSFWYGCAILFNLIFLIIYLLGASIFPFGFMLSSSARYWGVIEPILGATSAIMILAWVKYGFFIMVFSAIFRIILDPGVFSIIGGLIFIGFNYLILQLKKNDVPCWTYLFEGIPQNSNSLSSNKKCKMCTTIFPGSITLCPKCGSSLYEFVKNEPLGDNKCLNCQKLFSGTFTACPHCGSTRYETSTIGGIANRPITKDDSNIERKKCTGCNKLVSANIFKCPQCGGESFQ